MATAEVQPPPVQEPAPALPDYLTDPDAVLGDTEAKWRYGRAPDYSNTRKVFAETKQMTHEPLSLPSLVQNLVKNWEVEASFKPHLPDWRTIDHAHYSFAINSGEPEGAEAMLEVGTYNAIIAPNEYYSPAYSDFASSHKTFKRMMPTFAWEVLEVYSGPPTVSFRWRHWGVMKNDYVGFNDKGEKVTIKAHGGAIDIQGVTVATVNEKVQLQSVRTWFDPLEMFRQIVAGGVARKERVREGVDPADALDEAQEGVQVPPEQTLPDRTVQTEEEVKETEAKMDKDAEEGAQENLESQSRAVRSRELPAGHAPLSMSEDGTADDVRVCPFMPREFR
ncbi:Nn.00g096010.m01.CDS01 [Neocucurbitaria sp. VM-36]